MLVTFATGVDRCRSTTTSKLNPQALGHKRARRKPRRALQSYSFSMPALLMISPHFFDSAAWNFASSAGVVTNTSVPVGP